MRFSFRPPPRIIDALHSTTDPPPARWTPLTALAVAVTAGVALGLQSPAWMGPLAWAIAAALLAGAALLTVRRRHAPRVAVVLAALVCAAAARTQVHDRYVAADDIARTIGDGVRIARVEGVVEGEPYVASPHRGALGQFAFDDPTTLAVVRLTAARGPGGWQRASGRLLVSVNGVDDRLRPGDRVRAVGLLAALIPPMNPGEFDYPAWAARQGIAGRLTAETPANVEVLPPDTALLPALQRAAGSVAAAAHRSLRIGLGAERVPLSLLEALLLGRRDALPRTLSDAFRETGLAHLLSISGAHLSILVGLVWLLARVAIQRPARAAAVVLGVLAAYLLAVPPAVPLIRAAIMAACFLGAWALGRRFRGIDALATAALLCLLWRPGDLADPGFQLSFGVVAALLLFTTRIAARLTPAAAVPLDGPPTLGQRALQWAAGYLAVSIVAFVVALPLAALHFGMITPLAIVLSILSLPVVTAVLALGYLKIVVGLVLPSAGLVLAGPLAWLADVLITLTERAADWPGATITLQREPGALWAAATLTVSVALLSERLRGPVRAPLALAACTGWLALAGWVWAPPPVDTALRVNMIAVGDGSCFLVRGDGGAILFDCGSQSYLDVGLKSVGPALRRLGVRRLDALFISHADFDHYNGSLDALDAVPADRVFITPQFADQAHERPDGPARFVLDELARRGVPIDLIQRGDTLTFGDLRLAALWPPPPAEYQGPRDNDDSLVLRVHCSGRTMLLNGDVAQDAMTRLLAAADAGAVDLRADVMDLPHHGSFVDASSAYLRAVGPRLTLQSSKRRSGADKWAPVLTECGTPRVITAETGMAEVTLGTDGSLRWTTFREAENGER